MQPIPKSLPSPVVNWSIPGQLIGQLPAAVVVVNCPPFRGALTACRPHHLHWPQSLPTDIASSHAAAPRYAVVERAELITRQKRHRLTTAKPRVASVGGANVLS
jgi:hypothetical protein